MGGLVRKELTTEDTEDTENRKRGKGKKGKRSTRGIKTAKRQRNELGEFSILLAIENVKTREIHVVKVHPKLGARSEGIVIEPAGKSKRRFLSAR